MQLPYGHLTYCTNIHAGENWPSHFTALQQNFQSIKNQVSGDKPMGIGLRLSNEASLELSRADNLAVFKQWLDDNNAYVFTMNGFPYGDFHNAIVKDNVHAPDWTTTARLDYTLRMFDILAQLIPEGLDGGISTSPISYKYWHKTPADLEKAKAAGTANILSVVEALINIKKSRGIYLHLDIEPEPDGLLETGEEYLQWYEEVLLPLGKKQLSKNWGVGAEEAEQLIKDHVCLCYDVCHFAIGYEPHQQMVARLNEKGLKVGKIQISAALKANLPEDESSRRAIINEFAKYNEPVYLHQVVALTNDSSLIRYPDLPQALHDAANPKVRQWRAHFHVPIFKRDLNLLQSTQEDIIEVLQSQKNNPFTGHLEVETYTWGVLPDEDKLPINDSISRELNWVKDLLSK